MAFIVNLNKAGRRTEQAREEAARESAQIKALEQGSEIDLAQINITNPEINVRQTYANHEPNVRQS